MCERELGRERTINRQKKEENMGRKKVKVRKTGREKKERARERGK